mmetsp:Transcript_29162/g.77827  ORF Transcript_29162/g.77827 Transcript_29162/m.77827 type:complete len:223 (+) Transcript_29162:138-806(+)
MQHWTSNAMKPRRNAVVLHTGEDLQLGSPGEPAPFGYAHAPRTTKAKSVLAHLWPFCPRRCKHATNAKKRAHSIALARDGLRLVLDLHGRLHELHHGLLHLLHLLGDGRLGLSRLLGGLLLDAGDGLLHLIDLLLDGLHDRLQQGLLLLLLRRRSLLCGALLCCRGRCLLCSKLHHGGCLLLRRLLLHGPLLLQHSACSRCGSRDRLRSLAGLATHVAEGGE